MVTGWTVNVRTLNMRSVTKVLRKNKLSNKENKNLEFLLKNE